MIGPGGKNIYRCLSCVVEWSGTREDLCWSCGNPGINPWTNPETMLKVVWPSICSPYTERAPADGDGDG